MIKLTDGQLALLSSAAGRADGAAVFPANMRKATATKTAASLVARKLMRETRAKPGAPIWREDQDGRRVSLVITRTGRDAIGVKGQKKETGVSARPERCAPKQLPAKQQRVQRSRQIVTAVGPREPRDHVTEKQAEPRTGSKLALIVKMLSTDEGATIAALTHATGWLSHTTRAALTGLRKRGFAIERRRSEGAVASTYHIAIAASLAA